MSRPRLDRSPPMHPRDFHVLLVLAVGPLHGYAIVRQIEQQSRGRLRIDPANLYRTLARLAKENLIREVDVAGEPKDGRRRRHYELTEAGAAALRDETERMRALTVIADRRLRHQRNSS